MLPKQVVLNKVNSINQLIKIDQQPPLERESKHRDEKVFKTSASPPETSEEEDFDGNPEDVAASPIPLISGIQSPVSYKRKTNINRRSRVEESKVVPPAESDPFEQARENGPEELKHIPCLLIQKRSRVKIQKRESSVVNLLRSHMADLAKTYQLN